MFGNGPIASQCPNKRVMILKDDGEIEIEHESNDDSIPPLEDASDVEYPIDGELLTSKKLSVCKSKKMTRYSIKTSFILDAMSIIRYVA